MTTDRFRRVNEQVREVLAETVERLTDPRIGLVTITGVDVSADFRHAKVYYTVLGDDEQQRASLEGLKSATPFLRRAVGQQVRIKFTPDLTFHADEGIRHGQRIEEILRDIRRDVHEHDAARPSPETGESGDGDEMRTDPGSEEGRDGDG